MLILGIVFSLTTAIPILDVVAPKLTPLLLGIDIAISILFVRLVNRCRTAREQLLFIKNPALLLCILALATTYLVDWNYYSERFITLRYSLQLHLTAGWLTPANLMGLAGASLFGILSTKFGLFKSTAGCLMLWLISPFAFILATTSTPIPWIAAAVALFTFLESFAFTGIQTTATDMVPKISLGTFGSVLLGINTIFKSAGGALTSDVMTNTFEAAMADKLEPLPLSNELTINIVKWLSEGKHHLVLENDYNIPALVVNRYLLRTSPVRIDAFTSCLHALGYLCLAMISIVLLFYAASWLQQQRQSRLAASEA